MNEFEALRRACIKREVRTSIKLLRAAKKLLQTAGWGQHANYNAETGQYCLVGAVCRVSDSRDAYNVAGAEHALWSLYKLVGIGPAVWNDQYNRTQEEVEALLDTAIKRLTDEL